MQYSPQRLQFLSLSQVQHNHMWTAVTRHSCFVGRKKKEKKKSLSSFPSLLPGGNIINQFSVSKKIKSEMKNIASGQNVEPYYSNLISWPLYPNCKKVSLLGLTS